MKRIAAIFGGLAVILEALGAHALKDVLTPQALESFKTATTYQLFHAIAIISIPSSEKFKWTARFWIVGILLFSFSIYGLALDELAGLNLSCLGPITPLGGISFVLGWGFLWKSWTHETRS